LRSNDLIDGLVRLDPGSWGTFLSEHRQVVIRIVSRLVGSTDPASVADLEQEVYVRLLANDRESLRRLRDASAASLRAFVCTLAANVGRDHLRRRQVRAVVRSVSEGDPEEASIDLSGGEEPALSRMRAAEVLDALERVVKGPNAARDCLIFKAHYVDGMTAAEIGRMGLGIAPKGVEAVLFRLTAKLREDLRSRDEGLLKEFSRLARPQGRKGGDP